MDFLTEIVQLKTRRVAQAKVARPVDEVRAGADYVRRTRQPFAFSRALTADRINIIAEFKRFSPSLGAINPAADPASIARIYESNGAAAISVLTEEDRFKGSLEDLKAVRRSVEIPVLRKDFVIDEYQIFEAAEAGANAVLLIVAMLDDAALSTLIQIVQESGIDALVEVHTEHELERALACGARIIGVNNRDLHTFNVSLTTSEQLIEKIPDDVIAIAESGLNQPESIVRLKNIGFDAFLIGEALMRSDDPGKMLMTFAGRAAAS